MIPIKPKGDKVMRMHAHTATLEAGKVLLRKGAPWLDEFRSEVLAFPHGKHDDQVDALSQLMTWAEDRRIPKCEHPAHAVAGLSAPTSDYASARSDTRLQKEVNDPEFFNRHHRPIRPVSVACGDAQCAEPWRDQHRIEE